MWEFLNKRINTKFSHKWAKQSFISSAHLMPLSSPRAFPHPHVMEGLFPNAPLFFTGTALVSAENVAGVLLSSDFVSKHFRNKDRGRLRSETLVGICKQCITVIYEGCTLDTSSWLYASNPSRELFRTLGSWKSQYRHVSVAAVATTYVTG